jgi:DNA polymerase IV
LDYCNQIVERKIIHVDMDCFYAAVEILERPELELMPVAVGGSGNRRGVLTTCNYPARKFGLRSAMPTSQALKLCPDLIILPVRMDLYKEKSTQVFEIFKEYTHLVEGVSLDEAYLDVSESDKCMGSATLIAKEIRSKITQVTGLTASAGVATNKFLAKIGSDVNKPNGLFVLKPEEVKDFLQNLKVSKIWGVGKKLNEKLNRDQIYTCGDLYLWSKGDLEAKYGKMGVALYQYARGIDHREVKPDRERKSISVERTFAEDIPHHQVPKNILDDLYGALLIRWVKYQAKLKKEERSLPQISGLVVKVKFSNFQQTTKEQQLTRISKEVALKLIGEALTRGNKGIRLLGIGLKLKHMNQEQLDLFEL